MPGFLLVCLWPPCLRLRGLHTQLVADELEGSGDGLVHVIVLVAAQATGKDHVALLCCQFLILLVEGLVLGVVDGVVGLIAGLPVRRVLTRDDGLVLRAELKVLVLDDARVGDLTLGVVDHGHALVVLLVERLGLKAQTAVLERAQFKVVERVDGAAVDRLGGDIGLGGDQLLVLHAAAHLDALEHVGDHLGVAAHGDALVAVVEVVVVKGEAEGQTADDEGRQLGGGTSPLLLGIALDEAFVDVASAELERLLLQVGRLADVGIACPFLLDACPCLVGGTDAPELVEGVHVERQVVELAAVGRQGRVGEAVELHEPVHVVPHAAVVGVEDVCAVVVHLDAVDLFAIDVPACVLPLVDDQATLAPAGGFVGEDGTEESGSHDQVVISCFHAWDGFVDRGKDKS